MTQPDDQHAIRAARRGDRRAFALLVDRYWGRVCRWLRGLTGQPDLAEDLTQEAFLRAWRGLPGFRPEADFRAWLFSIARHALIDHSRRPDAATHPLVGDLVSRQPGPPDDALDREGEGQLAAACARLPRPYLAAFLLWSQEELSFAQVALALGINESTARWRVFKARQLLVGYLGSYLDTGVP